MQIRFLGHSCFTLKHDATTIIVDPFVDLNPQTQVDYRSLRADPILVTHGHGDHLGDAIGIAKNSGGSILAVNELALYCMEQGVSGMPAHYGGTIHFPFGSVKLVPAWHSSSVGEDLRSLGSPCGFVIRFFGHCIYHAGDTCLFGDMKLIGDIEKPEVALVPIGGHFTMGIDDAVYAVEFLRPRVAIPMHYNTWDNICCDPQEFRRKVEERTGTKCVILAPGEIYTL